MLHTFEEKVSTEMKLYTLIYKRNWMFNFLSLKSLSNLWYTIISTASTYL